jgi:mannose-6-phosphate isomerase-like protein (cupin superfamily)
MADATLKKIAEIPPYAGPHAIPGMRMRSAGRALGVTAWGMNVIEIDAGCTRYPEHDHTKDGQEEVYAVLRGSAVIQFGAEELRLEEGALVRVGPQQRRKIVPGPSGVTLPALGATPGQPYKPR